MRIHYTILFLCVYVISVYGIDTVEGMVKWEAEQYNKMMPIKDQCEEITQAVAQGKILVFMHEIDMNCAGISKYDMIKSINGSMKSKAINLFCTSPMGKWHQKYNSAVRHSYISTDGTWLNVFDVSVKNCENIDEH